MIKVLHYGLSENRGGIETYLYKLAESIDKNKFHFSFLDTNIGEVAFKEELLKLGCDIYKITPRRKSILKNRADLKMNYLKKKNLIFFIFM